MNKVVLGKRRRGKVRNGMTPGAVLDSVVLCARVCDPFPILFYIRIFYILSFRSVLLLSMR
jgi:hypothetical protein